jgi:4'-phosphopantetheinyl transferase
MDKVRSTVNQPLAPPTFTSAAPVEWRHDLPETAPGPAEVHLYRIMAPVDPRDGGPAGPVDTEILSAAELDRMHRYRSVHLRVQFAARHTATRRILARYAGLPAASLRLPPDANGKPFAPDHAGLTFNLSATAGMALLAVGHAEPIGVDVEALRPMPDALDLARRYFSAGEADALAGLDPAARDRAFLQMWTRKEAYLKGLGVGLSGDLAAAPAAPWQVADFVPGATTVAALASRFVPTAVLYIQHQP